MTSLHISNFPQDLYQSLAALAAVNHTTVEQEAVDVMRSAVKMPLTHTEKNEQNNAERLQSLWKKLDGIQYEHDMNSLDIVGMIREDRDR